MLSTLLARRNRSNRPPSCRKESGQSILEMTFGLIVLLLLLVAVVDFARIIDAGIVLTNAAREGARYGSVDPSLTVEAIQQIVINDVLGSGTNVADMDDFGPANVAVLVDDVAKEVRVIIAYDFQLWFGGIINVDTLTLSREAIMPIMGG